MLAAPLYRASRLLATEDRNTTRIRLHVLAAGLRRAILVALLLLFTAAGSELDNNSGGSAASVEYTFAWARRQLDYRYTYAYVPRWPTYVRDKVQIIKPPAQPCRFTTQFCRAIPSHRRELEARLPPHPARHRHYRLIARAADWAHTAT
jgi:hypothetical protein